MLDRLNAGVTQRAAVVLGLAVPWIAIALGFTACGKLAGLDYSVGEDAGTPSTHTSSCGAFEFAAGSARCSACIDKQCCAAATSCSKDPTCEAHMDCLARCGVGDECVSRCALDHPGVLGSYVAAELLACETSQCSDACSFSCKAQPGPVECAQCLGNRCCEELTNLGRSSAGLAYAACAWNSLEFLAPDDPENCENAHPDGLAAFVAARNCFNTSCMADCVGADFSCVGSVQWRFSMTDIKLHVQVVDALNLAVPLDGVTVRACTPDVSCDTPLATSRPTDADGRTTLIVPGFPALEYFELEKDGFVVLWYWLPPVHGTSAIKLPMGDAALRAELLSAVGGDPAAGAIGVVASSCRRLVVDTPNGAAGLEVGTERGDPVVYFNGLVPDVTMSATGAIGLAFVHSAAPGIVTVFTEYQGQRVGSWPVYVRPGMDTFIALPPTPRR